MGRYLLSYGQIKAKGGGMKFTCIICLHKFGQDQMDTEERICEQCESEVEQWEI